MIVIDASVLCKWVVEEPGSDAARSLAKERLTAPSLCLVECGNALWLRVKRRQLSADDVGRRLSILRKSPVNIVGTDGLVEASLVLAAELAHPIYDCCYLALALEQNCQVVTADARFMQATQRSRYADRIRLLGS